MKIFNKMKNKNKSMWKTKSLATKVAKKTVKYYLTKKRRTNIARAKWFSLITVAMLATVIILANISELSHEMINTSSLLNKTQIQSPVASDSGLNGVLREVSAYNAGIEAQTDDSPCISASGDDICSMLARGEKICATNFVPLGTKLYIKNYGTCIVLDRMNSRFKNRVDIAMRADEYDRAVKFGLQNLEVSIIN